MAEGRQARTCRDLLVYQKARKVTKRVFEIARSFPSEEAYSLTSQARRSSRSIGAQIAEAWAKRRYEKSFVNKLADAEQHETRHWLDTAADCGYIGGPTVAQLDAELAEIGRMLNSMMDKAELFCGAMPVVVREDAEAYFAASALSLRNGRRP